MSEDFFNLDDHINIDFSIFKKQNESGNVFFDVSLCSETPEQLSLVDSDLLILSTKWKYLDWDSKKNIMESSKVFDPVKSEVSYDPILYKDNLIKRCLLEWRFSSDDNGFIKADQDKIDRLPPNVVEKLMYFYEKAIEIEEDSLGKV
tara:strand:+ start:59 stop:499 length:441 start_codon:yes stop_codon:yes gene_type:complete